MKSIEFLESRTERYEREEAEESAKNQQIIDLCIKRQKKGWNVKLVHEPGYGYRIEATMKDKYREKIRR